MIDAHPLVTGYVSMNIRYLLLAFTLLAVEANADSSTLDAAIGGGIGGAAGAAIGNEVHIPMRLDVEITSIDFRTPTYFRCHV